MQDIDLTERLKEKMISWPRKIGRYHSSELYGITHKYLTVDKWLHAPERKVFELLKMWNGILVHDHIQRLLPAQYNEIKKEHIFKDITLVAKADHLPDLDEVWEFKTSSEEFDSSKPSHDYQVKIYCSVFERSVGKVFQPVSSSKGLFLKHIGTVERDDTWFRGELEKLYDFHIKIKEALKDEDDKNNK